MGFFDKKNCDFCGAKIGMLGNKKLKDGNMCKDCNAKLSPWFDDRGSSTIEDIRAQMNAREENRKVLDSFETTVSYGESGCILIDAVNKQFVALSTTSDRFFGNNKIITSIDEIKDKNPDIVKFSQVKNVEVKIGTAANERKKTEDGQQVSYNPPHMNYMCNFRIDIEVEHPYIRSMRIPINDAAISIECDEPRRVTTYFDEIKASLTGLKSLDYDIENNPDYREVNELSDIIFNKMKQVPDYSFGFKVDQSKNWKDIQKYAFYLIQCNTIKDYLEGRL